MAYTICGTPEQYQVTLHCEVLHDIRAIKKYNEFNKKKNPSYQDIFHILI